VSELQQTLDDQFAQSPYVILACRGCFDAPSFALRGIRELFPAGVKERAEIIMVDTESNTEPALAVDTEPSRIGPGERSSVYAIIETGGKQYRVAVGDTLSVEKLPAEAGTGITFDRVLMVGGDGSARVGTPLVTGATVQAEVAEQYRGPKIVVFKYKPKKRYRRRTGHRQSLTRVAITAINA